MSTECKAKAGALFKPLNRSELRLGLSLIIALSLITSPVVMLLNPTLVEASSSSSPRTTDPTSFSVPSTIAENGGAASGPDFTTQAALSSVTARPTNNIVTTTSFYDIVFTTATAGAIKTIEITFPAGTQMPATPLLNEVEGIGPGTASRSGQTIIYTVANAVNVPAGTRIRLEIANINNPVNPSTSYTVTVTTKNAANTPIDGSTPSTAYTIKQLGASIIAPNSITNTRIADGAVTNPKIASNAVTTLKIAPNAVDNVALQSPSVSNSKIVDNTITSDKVAPGTFGLPAAQRPGTVVNLPPSAPEYVDSDASCLDGEQVIGGGFDINAVDGRDFVLTDSFIVGNSWRVTGLNLGGDAMTLQSLAICALDFPL